MSFAKHFFSVLLILTAITTSAMADTGQLWKVKGTTDPAQFDSIQSEHLLVDRDSKVGLHLYQYGPANHSEMNGNHIGLTITPANKNLPAYTFETGIDVLNVVRMSLNSAQNAILLIVNEDVLVYPQEIISKRKAYRIFYKTNADGSVSDEIQVVRYRLEQ